MGVDLDALTATLFAEYQDEITRLSQELLRIPSRNTPPTGEEAACQRHVAAYLREAGLEVDMYRPDEAPGMVEHAAYWPGRDYTDRPNIHSLQKGAGGGRSLLLTGHVDTVALGDNVWTHGPFVAEIEDGKLYGLGSIDMKGPMAAMAVLFKALKQKGIRLKGDLAYEMVVDEEEGGVNATIAGRLKYGRMDAALIPEGTDLKLYPAARGALITDFIFRSGKGTWLDVGKRVDKSADAVRQAGLFLAHIDELSRIRQASHPSHPLYALYPDPVPVQVTKVYAGGWGPDVPIAVPPEARIEVIMQALPGEQRADVYGQMTGWLNDLMARYPDDFPEPPELRHRIRWMVPTAIDPGHPLVAAMADAATPVLGHPPEIMGAPYACDMFALHQIFDMPGILFGPTGANAHAADEYIELDSLYAFWKALLRFVLLWCEPA
jgi:acetylornithine deacetylase